jgi:hypothetical protein
MEQQQATLAELPVAVARAMEKADWPQVKDLSLRTEALKHAVTGDTKPFETARGIYAITDVPLDPFCHSLQKFTRVQARDWPALRTRVVELLATLEQSDVSWKDFYAGRRTAFQTRAPTSSQPAPGSGAADSTSAESMREPAGQALKAGDMRGLAQLAELLASGTPRTKQSKDAATTGTPQTLGGGSRPGLISMAISSGRSRGGCGYRHLLAET